MTSEEVREAAAKIADAAAEECKKFMMGCGVSAAQEQARHREANKIAAAIRAMPLESQTDD